MIESVLRQAARFVTSNYQQISCVTYMAFSEAEQKDSKSDHVI